MTDNDIIKALECCIKEAEQLIKTTKSEARKEFAERLKQNDFFANFTYKGEARLVIDKLLEEMEKENE